VGFGDDHPLAHTAVDRLAPDGVLAAQRVSSTSALGTLTAPVPWLQRDHIAGILSDPNHIGTGDQREGKVMRVHPAPDPHIEMIESDVGHSDTHLPGADNGIVDLHDAKNFWATVIIDSNRFHANAL